VTAVERPIVQTFRLSEDERATLEALAAHEERAIGDVIRRAIRAYAEEAGILPERPKATPPRKTCRKTALPPKGQKAGLAPSFLVLVHRHHHEQTNEVSAMKTSASTRVPQDGARKAPVRSTPARARSTPAKPLRPADAKAPMLAPSPTAAPGLAPLLAGLLALIEAHRTAAAKGPAAVVLRALAEVAALALRFATAPGAWRLESAASSPDAAGLALVPVEGALKPAAPAAPPARPRLNPAHLALVIGLEEALLRLAEAQQAAAGLARGTSRERPTAQLDFALEQLADALCGCAAEVTAAPVGLTPMAHVIALNDLANAADPGDPEACAELARLDVRAAASHFSRTSRD